MIGVNKKEFLDLKETLLKAEADRLNGVPSYSIEEAKQKLKDTKAKRLIEGDEINGKSSTKE